MAVIFCCTFLKVTLTGRYPASSLYGARTFLVRCLSTLLYATIRFTLLLLYYKFAFTSNVNWSKTSTNQVFFSTLFVLVLTITNSPIPVSNLYNSHKTRSYFYHLNFFLLHLLKYMPY